MGLNRKLRTLKQTEDNLFRLLRKEELPKIKEDLRKQWEEEQLKKKKISTRISKVVKRIFGK